MKNINFRMKLVSFFLVFIFLMEYQQIAGARAAEVEEREEAISEVEAYNKEIMRLNEEALLIYHAGSYEGEGTGFGSSVRVKVTVTDEEITDIELVEASGEDPAYLEMAEKLLPRIIKEQSTDLDTVSGATFSSGGILEAASDALGKAAR